MKGFVKASAALLLAVFVIAACVPAAPVTALSETYRDSGIDYTDNKARLDGNRERGWSGSEWIDCTLSGASVKYPSGGIYSLFYNLSCFSGGNSFTKTDYGNPDNPKKAERKVGQADAPISQAVLDSIRSSLDNARDANTSIIIRFAYTRDQNTGYDSTDFSTILLHISQLAPVLNEYKDVVLSVEAGMIGPWGEMHSSRYTADSSGDDTVATYIIQVLRAWLDNLDSSIAVQCRNIWGIIPFFGHTEASTFTAALDGIMSNPDYAEDYRRLGMYNDGYLGTYGDYGTWGDRYTTSGNRLLVRDDGIAYLNTVVNAPYGGELATVSNAEYLMTKKSPIYNDGTNPKHPETDYYTPGFIQELYSSHLTYIRKLQETNLVLANELARLTIDADDPLDRAEGIDMTEYNGQTYKDFMWDHMGYRIVVRNAENTDTAAPGGELKLRGALQNVGFGGFLRERAAEIILTNGTVTYTAAASFDPGTLTSTATEAYDLTYLLPADMPTGEYTIYMRIKNRDLSDSTGIAFANNRASGSSVYSSSLHANRVGTVTISGAAVSGNTAFCEKGTEPPAPPEAFIRTEWVTGPVSQPLEIAGNTEGALTLDPDDRRSTTLVIRVEGASSQNPVTVGGLSYTFEHLSGEEETVSTYRSAWEYFFKMYNSVNGDGNEPYRTVLGPVTEDGVYICQYGKNVLASHEKRVSRVTEFSLNKPLEADKVQFVAASQDAGGQAAVSVYCINGGFNATVNFYDGETLLDTQTYSQSVADTAVTAGAAPLLSDLYSGESLGARFMYWADAEGNRVDQLSEDMDVYAVYAEIDLSSISLLVSNGIGIYIEADRDYLETYGFTDPYVTVYFGDAEYTLTNPTVRDGYLSFLFNSFGPQAMGDRITAVISGGGYTSAEHTFSIKGYCEYLLTHYTGVVHDLAADILNYGAQCQLYRNYRTDEPVNAGLTAAEQSRWQDMDLSGIVSAKELKDSDAAEIKAAWKSATLYFHDVIDIKVRLIPTDTTGIKVRARFNGRTYWITEYEEEASGVLSFVFDKINPTEFNIAVEFEACDADGVTISQTAVYSVDSYIRSKMDDPDSSVNLRNMLQALRRYAETLTEFTGR